MPSDRITQRLFVEHCEDIVSTCVDKNTDRVIAVCGVEGMGKSGVAHVGQRLMDPNFDPAKQVHWTVPRYVAAEYEIGRGRPLRMDELIRAGTSYRAQESDSRDFIDRMFINRELNHPQLLLHPQWDTFNSRLRDHRVWFLWHVTKRYDRHAIVKVKQVRNGEQVFNAPRHLFTATIPKPTGPLWDLEMKLKHEFGRAQADGKVESEDRFNRVVREMRRRLEVFRD